MTFEHTATATSEADPAAVWDLWADPGTWPGWDPSVVAVALDGPFAAGTTGTMTLAGPVDVPLVLVVVDPGRRYLDELRLGELVIRIDHVVEPDEGGGSAITVTTTVEGPGADDVGPMVTAEAPLALAALTSAAEAP